MEKVSEDEVAKVPEKEVEEEKVEKPVQNGTSETGEHKENGAVNGKEETKESETKENGTTEGKLSQ